LFLSKKEQELRFAEGRGAFGIKAKRVFLTSVRSRKTDDIFFPKTGRKREKACPFPDPPD
jgi:hypothetical protein